MELEKQVCSLELAKRLKELGVEQESYFVWCEYPPASPPWTMKYGVARLGDSDDYAYGHHRTIWSAFTVAELGEMLKRKDNILMPVTISGKWCGPDLVNRCQMTFGLTGTMTEADARAKMLIYLLENHLIRDRHDRSTDAA